MPNYSRTEIVLVRFPLSDLTNSKVRPGIVVSASHASRDLFVVPLTSKTDSLLQGEFILSDWQTVGLNVETAVKRGIFTIHEKLVVKSLGHIVNDDIVRLEESFSVWLGLP